LPPRAQRSIDPPEEDPSGEESDLFAEGAADLFTAEPDLFGGDSTEEAEAPGQEDLFIAGEPVPAHAPPQPPKPALQPSRRQSPNTPRPFIGYDDRVCRQVEASYPIDYDKEGRPTNNSCLDLTIIEPIGNRRGIVVDQIRGLQDVACQAPIEGAYRVVLIFGADSITQEGGNSILKLMEEPPGFLVMILTADQGHRVLPTIRSRCSVVPLAPLDQESLRGKLVEEERLDAELARVAASLSEGRPGAALSIVGSNLLNRRREVLDARLQVDRFGWCALAAAAARINASGKLDEGLWLLLSFCRDRLVQELAPNQPDLLVHGDMKELATAAGASIETLDEEADRLVKAFAKLQHPFIPNARAILQEVLWPEG
jgi:hypothetical protein